MKLFSMSHHVFVDSKPEVFSEESAPDWLTSNNTVKGSTMDNRWFWNERVLALNVGESIQTDCRTVTRTQ